LPVVASVNVGALTNASAAAAQATIAAQDAVQRERATQRQALPSVFTVRVLGFGDEPAGGAGAPESRTPDARSARYDADSPVQVLGRGHAHGRAAAGAHAGRAARVERVTAQ
jgi:hypothetical protein